MSEANNNHQEAHTSTTNAEVSQHNMIPNFGDNVVCAIRTPKLPEFLKERPDLWFYMVESEFSNCGTRSDDTKFNTVIRALGADTLQYITDILRSPPTTTKYEILKSTLLKRVSDSREKQVQRLLNDLTLSEKKPSQLMREMQDLAAGSVKDEILLQLWRERLPHSIRPLLAMSNNLSLDALAEMADRLLDATGGATVMATSISKPIQNTSNLESKIDILIQLMYTCIQEMKNSRQVSQPSSSGHRTRSRTPSFRSRDANGVCRYHQKYGDKAWNCLKPCSYKPSKQNTNQEN